MRLYASLLRHTPYDIESRAGARARKGITTNPTMLANPPPPHLCLPGWTEGIGERDKAFVGLVVISDRPYGFVYLKQRCYITAILFVNMREARRSSNEATQRILARKQPAPSRRAHRI